MLVVVLLVAATVAYGVWGFCLKKAVLELPPLVAAAIAASTQLLLAPIFVVLARHLGVSITFSRSGFAWAAAAAATAGVAQLVLLYVLQRDGGSRAVALTAAYPLVTMTLCVLFLSEPLTTTKVIGVVCVAVGAVLLSA